MRFETGYYLGLVRSLLIYYGRPFRVRNLARFYAPFVSPGDLCFDVGAHVGTHSLAFRRIGARVVGVEPQPLFFWFLELLFRAEPEVRLLNEALGASQGAGSLRLSALTPTVSSLSEPWMAEIRDTRGFERVSWGASVPVNVRTLDDLIQTFGRPAFCKIDVEGSESAILHGLSHSLPAISFEYLPAAAHYAEECVGLLSHLGRYEYNATVGEQMELHFGNWLSSAEITAWLNDRSLYRRSGDIIARLAGG